MPKVYVFLGLSTVYFSLIFFNIGGQFLVNTIGFVLPAYYSLDALFSAGKVDDTQVSRARPALRGSSILPTAEFSTLSSSAWLERGKTDSVGAAVVDSTLIPPICDPRV